MNAYLIVFLGAGLGGMLRHLFNVVTPRLLGPGVLFPYHTLTVNILGSFLIGVLAGYFAFRGDASQSWRLFMTTGLLGGSRPSLRFPSTRCARQCHLCMASHCWSFAFQLFQIPCQSARRSGRPGW